MKIQPSISSLDPHLTILRSKVDLSATQNGLDPALVASVVRCESRFNATAVSPRGAIGLMQMMPETATWIAQELAVPNFEIEQLYDPVLNLRFGSW